MMRRLIGYRETIIANNIDLEGDASRDCAWFFDRGAYGWLCKEIVKEELNIQNALFGMD